MSWTKCQTFSFENKLQDIKRCIKRPDRIVEQIIRRTSEGKILKNSGKRREINKLSGQEGNNYFLLSNGKICFLKSIKDQQIIVEVVNSDELNSLFEKPCDSILFNIYSAKMNFMSSVVTIPRHTLQAKVACIPVKDNIAFIPLIHEVF